MAFIPAPDTVLLELVYLWEDQVVENTLYWKCVASPSATELAALAGSAAGWWNANCQGFTNVNVSLQQVKATDLTTDSSPSVTYTIGLPTFGDVTGDPLPNNCSLAISFRTLGRGRSSRGRNYIVGLSEASVSGNTVDPTFIGYIQSAYEALSATLNADVEGFHAVVSRYHNNAPRAEALVQEVTAYVIVDPFIDSQRRRLPGRGR